MELNGWFSIAMLPSMGSEMSHVTVLHPTDHLDVARCQVRPDSWRHAQQKTLRVQPPECAAGQLCAKFSSRDWTRMTTVPWQKRRCPIGNSWGIQEVFHNHKNRNQFAKGSPRASKVWIARSRDQTHRCSMHLLMVDRSVRPSARKPRSPGASGMPTDRRWPATSFCMMTLALGKGGWRIPGFQATG